MGSIYSCEEHPIFRSDDSKSAWEDSWDADPVFKPYFSWVWGYCQPFCATICVLSDNLVLRFDVFQNFFQFSFTNFCFLQYHYTRSILFQSLFEVSLFASAIEASYVPCFNNHFNNFGGCWKTSDNDTTLPKFTSSSPTIYMDSFIGLLPHFFPPFPKVNGSCPCPPWDPRCSGCAIIVDPCFILYC